MNISLQALRDKRDQLTASLARVDDLRPGFLTARFRKCGKRNCHCAQKDSPGHGPSYSLTHRLAGKTITQVIPQGPAVERTKAQIAEYHRFRKLVRELILVSEQICSAQVREAEALPASEAKKNLFAGLLAPQSFRRSRRSSVDRRWKIWIWKRWNSPCGNRSCSWLEPRSSNVSTLTPAMSEARELVVLAVRKRAWLVAGASGCRASSALYKSSAPTIIAPGVDTASVLAMNIWA